MARIRTVTDAGNALNAQALRDDVNQAVTRIELGTGHVTTAALARARTGVVTPFAPRNESLNPPILAEAGNPVAQVIYFEEPDGDTYDYNEIAVMAGSTCIYYECDDAGATIGTKEAAVALAIHIALVFSNGDPALVARQFVFAPLATTAQRRYGAIRQRPGHVKRVGSADPGASADVGTDACRHAAAEYHPRSGAGDYQRMVGYDQC